MSTHNLCWSCRSLGFVNELVSAWQQVLHTTSVILYFVTDHHATSHVLIYIQLRVSYTARGADGGVCYIHTSVYVVH